jgi:hypothetical protein
MISNSPVTLTLVPVGQFKLSGKKSGAQAEIRNFFYGNRMPLSFELFLQIASRCHTVFNVKKKIRKMKNTTRGFL